MHSARTPGWKEDRVAMEITPDHLTLFRWGIVQLNATIVYTWVVMFLLVLASWLATRKVAWQEPRSMWAKALEAVVCGLRSQIREISGGNGADDYLPFIGTLFLFVAISNEFDVIPGWHAPTGSLSTTAALAICVAVSVPIFGIRKSGLKGYLHHYLSPTVFMLPIHVMSEISRTMALAIRLFGNIMSGTMVVAILLALVPLFFPVLMQVLGLVIGLIQAYIFAVLALVYIAAAVRRQEEIPQEQK
jgi:F-type H+-transporting ATPase subunit a